MSRYDWMSDARCAQVDPDLWHQDGRGDNYAAAKRICQRCPVRPQCEAYTDRLDADANAGRHGMWAARTKSQREARHANAERQARQAAILRLIERGGMEPAEIADHVGCSERTVWRVLANRREQTAQGGGRGASAAAGRRAVNAGSGPSMLTAVGALPGSWPTPRPSASLQPSDA